MWWRVAVMLAAAAAAVVPLSPAWVERAYSASVYRAVQRLLTPLSNLVPFALFDGLIVVALAAWIGATVVDVVRRRPWRRCRGSAAVADRRHGGVVLPRVPASLGLELPARQAGRQAAAR